MYRTSLIIFSLVIAGMVGAFFFFNVQERVTDPGRFFMQKYTVQDATRRDARCNDGSEAVFYHRPAQEGFQDKWVIYLEGGEGVCTSPDDCYARLTNSPELTSSKDTPKKKRSDGILSTSMAKNAGFSSWNHVSVHYCSSDAWQSNISRSVGGRIFYFAGKEIVRAVFEDLQSEELFGPHNLSDATEVVFAGTDAGGEGVLASIDDMAASVPFSAWYGVLDAAWSIPGAAEDQTAEERIEQVRSAYAFLGIEPGLACQNDATEDGSCHFLSTRYSYVKTPVFVSVDQRDPALFVGQPVDTVRDSLSTIEAVFSPNKGTHGLLVTSSFYRLRINGKTLADTLRDWVFEASSDVHRVE